MKKIFISLAIILTTFIAVSCNKGEDNTPSKKDLLIGYWQGEKSESGTYYLIYYFEKNGNGKYDLYYSKEPASTTQFKWSLSGDDLTINDGDADEHYTILVLTEKTLRWQETGSSKVENYSKIE